jgi:hypothetical protein
VFYRGIIERNKEKLERALSLKLREYSFSEVQDFSYRLRDVEWDEQKNPSRELSIEEQDYIVNEKLLTKVDFEYFCSRYCKILTVEKRLETIIPWPSQRYLLDIIAEEEKRQMDAPSIKIPIVLLKSRQVGGTAISEAMIAHMVFLNSTTQGVIASDHPDNTLKLFQTLVRIYDNLPKWLQPTIDGKVKGNHLHFPHPMDSDVIAGSGNQKTTLGQGMTIDIGHLTEVSTWIPEMCHAIDGDILPAFNSSRKHHSLIILESTGAGGDGNWFHDHFQASRAGETTFKHAFIAWYMRPSWRLSAEGVEFREETLLMQKRVEREVGIKLDREQLAWYQITRRDLESKGDLELFYQEYPSTIEEAFQTGYRSVFPIELISKVRDECRKPLAIFKVNLATSKLQKVNLESWTLSDDIKKWDNIFIMWELPKAGCVYVVGVDGAYGIAGRDNSAIEVLRVGNKNWGDEQVAEWCGNISPYELAKVAKLVGEVYRDKSLGLEALMACEVNPGSPTLMTQIELQRMGYINFYTWQRPLKMNNMTSTEYGWWTTQSTRHLLTERIEEYIKKFHLKINSPPFTEEMRSFVNTKVHLGQKHIEHAPGKHDDRIMALGIALYVAHENDVQNMAEERRRDSERKTISPEKHIQLNATGMGWDEAMTKWEESLGL